MLPGLTFAASIHDYNCDPALQGASSKSIATRRVADNEKTEMLSQLLSTATRAPSSSRGTGAETANARRSFSLRKNLSHHLDLGSPAVPASKSLRSPALNGRAPSDEEQGDLPGAAAAEDASAQDQVGPRYFQNSLHNLQPCVIPACLMYRQWQHPGALGYVLEAHIDEV